jgi:hypothetical protein
VTGWQLVTLWAMTAFAAFGLPGYFVGWWNGRRCLRHVLDPANLPPVLTVVHEVRIVSPDTATTMPLSRAIEPPWLWSEQQVALDAIGREVGQMIDATRQRAGWYDQR